MLKLLEVVRSFILIGVIRYGALLMWDSFYVFILFYPQHSAHSSYTDVCKFPQLMWLSHPFTVNVCWKRNNN